MYESGHAGSATHLIDGILIAGGSVRVAVRNPIPYTFGRAVGLDSQTVTARSRVAFNGNLLPIAVRNFVNAPGSNAGAAPCVDDQRAFMDFFATANTACLGTDVNSSNRLPPTAGAAFSPSNPGSDPANHGPVVEILGQGSQPGNGADFRGFVALDIRNYQNTLVADLLQRRPARRDVEHPEGPGRPLDLHRRLPGSVLPARDHAARPDGPGRVSCSATRPARRSMPSTTGSSRGDAILVAVYSGLTMQIPDFQMNAPAAISLPTTGTTATVGNFKVSRNQSFAGQRRADDRRRPRRSGQPDHERHAHRCDPVHVHAEPGHAVDGPGDDAST